MSILLVTSVGELVFDLFTDSCPNACENFLKLCSLKYYNSHLIYNIQSNYIGQSGDPTGTGNGGNSLTGILQKSRKPMFFDDEINEKRSLSSSTYYLGMAHINNQPNTNASQFFITLRIGDDEILTYFKKNFTIFGQLGEGNEVISTLNELYCDENGRPYQDVRILHTYVLDDPYPNPSGLIIPDASPERQKPEEERIQTRIPYEPPKAEGEEVTTMDGRTEDEILKSIRDKEAKSRAIVLEMTGDIPDADIKPPIEVLFICKLNPVTRDEDLELIFSRFGKIKSCEIVRDFKTGDSLNYAFIEYEKEASCIEAYEKMNNVLIDDRRIKVDFSQSVSKLWNRFLMKPRGIPQREKKEAKERDREERKPVSYVQKDETHKRIGNGNENENKRRDYGTIESKEKSHIYNTDRDRERERDYERENERGEKRRSRFDNDDEGGKHDSSKRRRSRDRDEKRPPRSRTPEKRDSNRDRDFSRERERRRERYGSRDRNNDKSYRERSRSGDGHRKKNRWDQPSSRSERDRDEKEYGRKDRSQSRDRKRDRSNS
jgi:peptidyl-prolyl cis-trans isomerase-like 4